MKKPDRVKFCFVFSNLNGGTSYDSNDYEEARPRENSDAIFCIFISFAHFLVLNIFMAEEEKGKFAEDKIHSKFFACSFILEYVIPPPTPSQKNQG